MPQSSAHGELVAHLSTLVSCAPGPVSSSVVALILLGSGVSIKPLAVKGEHAECGQLGLDMVRPIGYNSVV